MGQYFSPKPSARALTQGELWKGRSHCQPVIPFLASFDLHFQFSCSSCSLHATLPGSGCISSSACPSYSKAFEIWGLKDEGGCVLSPAPRLHCIYNKSWCLLAAPGLLQSPGCPPARAHAPGW